MPSRIFLTALELNVFGQLGSENLTVSEMAHRMKTDIRATEILLNALVGMKVLGKKKDTFSNVDGVRELLDPDSANYHGGVLRHSANLWDVWSHLTEVVKTGRSPQRQWTDEMRHDLAMAMAENAGGMAEKMARIVDFSEISHLLDLGGGPGSWTLALAGLYPNLQAVIFDKDSYALALAEQEIEKLKFDGRICVRKGDFMVEDLGSGYDAVFLSLILCLSGLRENAALLEKIYASLEEGGRLIIHDSFLNKSRTEPVSSAMFAVNMLVATPHGRTYAYGEIKGMLEEAGFKDVHRIPMERLHLAIGRK